MPFWLIHIFRRAGDAKPARRGHVVEADTADQACDIGIREHPGAGAIGVAEVTPVTAPKLP